MAAIYAKAINMPKRPVALPSAKEKYPYQARAVYHNDSIVVFGGYDSVDGKICNSLQFLPATSSSSGWILVECEGIAPSPRVHHTFLSLRKDLFVYGGEGCDGKLLQDAHLLEVDASHRRWKRLEIRNAVAMSCHASCIGNCSQIILHGGQGQSDGRGLFSIDSISLKMRKLGDTVDLPPLAHHCIVQSRSDLVVMAGGTIISSDSPRPNTEVFVVCPSTCHAQVIAHEVPRYVPDYYFFFVEQYVCWVSPHSCSLLPFEGGDWEVVDLKSGSHSHICIPSASCCSTTITIEQSFFVMGRSPRCSGTSLSDNVDFSPNVLWKFALRAKMWRRVATIAEQRGLLPLIPLPTAIKLAWEQRLLETHAKTAREQNESKRDFHIPHAPSTSRTRTVLPTLVEHKQNDATRLFAKRQRPDDLVRQEAASVLALKEIAKLPTKAANPVHRAVVAATKSATIDLSTVSASEVNSADLYVVRQGLLASPRIHKLNISQKKFGSEETQMLDGLLHDFVQLTEIVVDGAQFSPAGAGDAMISAAANNAAILRSQRKKYRRHVNQQRKAQKLKKMEGASEITAVHRRRQNIVLNNCIREKLDIEAHSAIHFVGVEERAARHQLRIEFRREKAEVDQREQYLQSLWRQMGHMYSEQLVPRQVIADEYHKETAFLVRLEKEHRREAQRRMRCRLRDQRGEREALEKEDKAQRLALKVDEDDARKQLMAFKVAEIDSLLKAHQERLDRARREALEKRRREEEEMKEREMKELRAAEALRLAKDALRRHVDNETAKRQVVLVEEVTARQDLFAAESIMQADALRKQGISERKKQRQEAQKNSPKLVVVPFYKTRNFCLFSTGPRRLLPRESEISVHFSVPLYFHDKGFTEEMLEPGELTHILWNQQQRLFLGGKCEFFLQDEETVEGDSLVFDHFSFLYDNQTGAVLDLNEKRLGTVLLSSNGRCLTIEVSYLVENGLRTLSTLIRNVAFLRTSGETSQLHGSIKLEVMFFKPSEITAEVFEDIQQNVKHHEVLFPSWLSVLGRQSLVVHHSIQYVALVVDQFLLYQRKKSLPLFCENYENLVAQHSMNFEIAFVDPVLVVPPEKLNLTYVEAQGDCLLLAKAMRPISKPGKWAALPGLVIYVDMGPLVHPNDYISTSLSSDVNIKNNVLYAGAQRVGDIILQGALFGHCLRIGEDTRIEVAVSESVPAKAFEAALRGFVFRNDSDNPTEVVRTVRIGIRAKEHKIESSALFRIAVEEIDNSAVIDFKTANPYIPFRAPYQIEETLQQMISTPQCHFGLFADLYDPDSDYFRGGFFKVVIDSPTQEDAIFLKPDEDSFVDIDGKQIFVQDHCVGQLVEDTDHAKIIQFERCSVEAVAEILRAFCYSSTAKPSSLVAQNVKKIICVEFAGGPVRPVEAFCSIKITEPLLTVPVSQQVQIYKEKSGPMRFPFLSVTFEDDGWDSGSIHIKVVAGATSDDLISITEDDDVTLASLNLSKSPVARSSPAVTPKPSFATGSDIKSRIRAVAAKHAENRARRRSEALAAAREKRALAHRRRSFVEDVEKVVLFQKKRIGVIRQSQHEIEIDFDDNLPKSCSNRRAEASVTRKEVESLLKRLTFENTSDNPTELRKVIVVEANDGLPHSSIVVLQVQVQATDNATEIRRLQTEPRTLRSKSEVDLKGFCAFDDVSLHDPDTFIFNGAFLHVDLVGGGDAKADQLGFLSVEEQLFRHPNWEAVQLQNGKLSFKEGREFGNWSYETLVSGSSSLRITFAPLASDAVCSTHEEAECAEGVISLSLVQKVLHLITFSSVTTKIKSGTRVYQLKVGFEGQSNLVGKLRVPVSLQAPVLWNPEFASEVKYHEGKPPICLFPKVVVNLNEKELVKEGEVVISLTEGYEEADKLTIETSRTEFGVKENRLTVGMQTIGILERAPSTITLRFDHRSKGTVKQIAQFLKCIFFHNDSEAPGEQLRIITLSFQRVREESYQISLTVILAPVDNPTEIRLNQDLPLEVIRQQGGALVAANADVYDPDTERFGHETFISCELKGGAETDSLALQDFDETQSDVIVGNRSIAEFRRKSALAFKLQVVSARCDELTALVRRVVALFPRNLKDKATRKTITFEIGNSRVRKQSHLVLDVLPSLVETHVDFAQPLNVGNASVMNIFPKATVPPIYFNGGFKLEVELVPTRNWYSLQLKCDESVCLDGTATQVLQSGKQVASFEDINMSHFCIFANVSNAPVVQAILNRIVIEITVPHKENLSGQIQLTDIKRNVTFVAPLTIFVSEG